MATRLAIALLVLMAANGQAADWKVRLFWLSRVTSAVVMVDGRAPVRLTVQSRPMHFDGSYTLAVPGAETARLASPLDVTVHDGRLLFTLAMPREEYVEAVLAGESSVFKAPQALQAMAVTARSYALHFAGRHRMEGFDFCDTTHCQDARVAARSARLRAAVESTESEALWYQGNPAAAYYSRHCGGTTEAGEAPYLPSHPDRYCVTKGAGEWRTQLSAAELKKAGLGLPVEIAERSRTGRVTAVRAGGRRLPVDALLGAIGENLGWNRLRSSWFTVYPAGDGSAFEGRGSGHGVGLCQAGAAVMGEQGLSYREILAYYFPETKVGVNAQGFGWRVLGGERVDLWTTAGDSDGPLVALADRQLLRAEAASGWRGPQRVRLKLYPTVAAFRDATGEPGTVAGSTVAGTVRLQPAAGLRSRGVVESTLLHEMLHVVLETRTRPDVPVWFREGLAAALAGQRSSRVRPLIDRYGRETVMGWLSKGLPAVAR
ncbi:MAG: SpoIID/LytB domain-containing protein [Bryobacteraceae bacterium]